MSTLSAQLGWSHLVEILRLKNDLQRDFYDEQSLEIRLKQLDVDIKMRKTEAKKLLSLEEKIKAQREIKTLERQRNEMRMNLYK